MQRWLMALCIGLLSAPAFGDEVSVKRVHLCCGACVKAVEDVLGQADGVSELKIDKDAGTVAFQVDDRKTARAAMRKLANAGFAGEATFGGKKLALPKITVEPGTTANSLEITDVHLCCGGCVKAVQEALKDVKGISKVDGDMDKGVVKIEGQDVDVRAVIESLRKAGFNGKPSA